MFDFIDEIAAYRWKILRMKPFQYGSFSNLDIQVSDEEFEEFVERNRDRKGKEDGVTAETGMKTARREIVVEPDMKASYVLIDSNGYLLDNAVDEMTPVVVSDCSAQINLAGSQKRTG